jgi:hypothetical protein
MYVCTCSAIFLKKIGSGMHSDPKLSQIVGGVSYIDARTKKVPGRCSSLRPSEKELPGPLSQKYPCVLVCMSACASLCFVKK